MMRGHSMRWILLLLWCGGLERTCEAGVWGPAVRETLEVLERTFGRELAGESTEQLGRRIESLARRHGEEAHAALRRVGPRTFQAVEQAGANAPDALRLLGRFGEDGLWILRRPGGLGWFQQYGDDAVRALLRHPDVAEPLLARYGQPAARALVRLSERNARRLKMLADDGLLAAGGRADDLLAVVGRHGDRAMAFVWRHKGSLAVASVLAVFLNHPEPFLDGVLRLPVTAAAAWIRWTALAAAVVLVTVAARRVWRRSNAGAQSVVAGGDRGG